MIANDLTMGHKYSKPNAKAVILQHQSPAEVLRETAENARTTRKESYLIQTIADIQQAADQGEFSLDIANIAPVRLELLELSYSIDDGCVSWVEYGTCCCQGIGNCAFCSFRRTYAYNNMKYAHDYDRLYKRMEAASNAGESLITCEDPIPVG